MAYPARLRIELPARPGALGAVTGTVGRCGGSVSGVDVHEVDERAVVELVVDLPDTVCPADVGRCLALEGVGTLLTSGPARQYRDPVARALYWAGELASVGAADRHEELARALADVCSATAWVAPAEEAQASEAGRLALERAVPVAVGGADVPVTIAPGLALGAELVAVPDGTVVAFLARAPGAPFTRTEVDRASALLAVCRSLDAEVPALAAP